MNGKMNTITLIRICSEHRTNHLNNEQPRGGALGYFLGGYVPPGNPDWHPVVKKILLKLIPHSRNGPIFYTPFWNSP